MKVKYLACSLAGMSMYVTMLVGQLSDRHFVSGHQPAVSAALVAGAVLIAFRVRGLQYDNEDYERNVFQLWVEIVIVILCMLVVAMNCAAAVFMYGETAAHNEQVILWFTCVDVTVEAALTATLWWYSRKRSPA